MSETATSGLPPAIATAIAELEEDFEEMALEPDGTGGVFVSVPGIHLGKRWDPSVVTIEFAVPYNYPFAPIYPYYTTPALRRTDGGPWPQALQLVTWRGRPVAQISLRASRWQPSHDTAASNLSLVRHWFQTVP